MVGGRRSCLETGFGDEWLKVGAVKFFIDGGITGAAGAFHEPYKHQPESRGHLKLAPEETVSVEKALATYTTHAAWSDCEEERRGRLEAWKVGDLIVMRDDPVSAPPEQLQHLLPTRRDAAWWSAVLG